MSRSLKHVATGTTLNFLKACNILYIQPLIDVALHIHTTADTLKANKQDAAELAECVGNTVRKISERHSEELCTPMQQDDVYELLATLRDINDSLTVLSRRRRIQRWIYHKEDQQTLRKHKESIGSAKLEYLFSDRLSEIAQKRTEAYALYTLKDIESLRVVTLGPVRDEVGRIVQSGEVKSVLIRRYNEQSIKNFLSDLAFYSKLTHPNFPFIGASSTSSPSPFMIFEFDNYQHALAFFDQVRDHGSVEELLKHAVIVISDLLAALDYYCENIRFELFDNINESIKYNGHKMILDLKPRPPSPALPTLSRQKLAIEKRVFNHQARDMYNSISLYVLRRESTWDGGFRHLGAEALATLMIPPTTYFEPFPDTPAIGPLWPFWLYLHASKADHTLFMVTQKIRDVTLHTGSPVTHLTPHIAHSLILDYGNALYVSVPQYGGCTKAELGDVGYFDEGVFIKATNILQELRAQSIVGSDIILSGSANRQRGCDHRFGGGGSHNSSEQYWYSLSPSDSDYFHSRIKSSIHDTSDKATRRKVQKYFHNCLPSILAQHLDRAGLIDRYFVLVVEIDVGHSIFSDILNRKEYLKTTKSLSDIQQYDAPVLSQRELRAARSTSDLSNMCVDRESWVRCAVGGCVPD